MAEQLIYRTFIPKSSDFAEFEAAEHEGRSPNSSGY